MTGLGTTAEDLSALAEALLTIDSTISPTSEAPASLCTPLPRRVLSAGQALDAKTDVLLLEQAAGRTAAEYLWAYPPGIPLIVPGEEIPTDFPALCARASDVIGAVTHWVDDATILKLPALHIMLYKKAVSL